MFKMLRNKKVVTEFVFFLWLCAGSIAVGETLLHFDLVKGHTMGDFSGEDISAKQAAEYPRP